MPGAMPELALITNRKIGRGLTRKCGSQPSKSGCVGELGHGTWDLGPRTRAWTILCAQVYSVLRTVDR